jgi:hypothetical protein
LGENQKKVIDQLKDWDLWWVCTVPMQGFSHLRRHTSGPIQSWSQCCYCRAPLDTRGDTSTKYKIRIPLTVPISLCLTGAPWSCVWYCPSSSLFRAPTNQAALVFASVFVLVWVWIRYCHHQCTVTRRHH